ALVQCHDLGDFWRVVLAAVSPVFVRDRMCHASKNPGPRQQSQCRYLRMHHCFLPCAFSPGERETQLSSSRCRGESLLTLRREESGHDVPMSGTNRGRGPNWPPRRESYRCQETGGTGPG